MCAYIPDKDMAYRELHHYHKTVFVPLDIEHISLVPDIIRSWKISFDIRKVFPFRPIGYLIPTFQRCFRVGMSFRLVKFNQSLM